MRELHLLWQLYLLSRNAKRTKAQMEALQEKKLRKLLRYAYQNSPYYHSAFEAAGITAETLDQTPLHRFPTLDKAQLMAHYDQIVTDRTLTQEGLRRYDESGQEEPYLGRYHVVHSSGSTGTPRYFAYDGAAWTQMLLGIIRGALWGMGMPEILKLLAGKPRILYIAATDGRYGGAMAVGDGIQSVGAQQRFLDINTPLAQWGETVRDFQPDIVIGYPSAIKILAELLETEGTQLTIGRVISCGEPLSPGLRSYLETAFGATVINFYGASESLALGVEESTGEGMFLFDDLNVVEIADGGIYVTCLYNFAQPLIRYHISDHLAGRESGPNTACPFTCSDVLLCRNEDVLWFTLPDGRREFLHPLSIEGFCVEGLLDYQFRPTGQDAFEMLAEISRPTAAPAVSAAIEQQMKEILTQNGLEHVHFTIRFVDDILPDPQTGKKPLVLTNLEELAYENDHREAAV